MFIIPCYTSKAWGISSARQHAGHFLWLHLVHVLFVREYRVSYPFAMFFEPSQARSRRPIFGGKSTVGVKWQRVSTLALAEYLVGGCYSPLFLDDLPALMATDTGALDSPQLP